MREISFDAAGVRLFAGPLGLRYRKRLLMKPGAGLLPDEPELIERITGR